MKEYAKIIKLTGRYTSRSKNAGLCELNGVYELLDLTKRSAKLKNENGQEFPVFPSDNKCLSQDEIDLLGLDNGEEETPEPEEKVEVYEPGHERASSKPLTGCTGVETIPRDTSDKKIKTLDQVDIYISEKTYCIMVAVDTQCRIEDRNDKHKVIHGDIFFCERIKNGCAYVHPTYMHEGVRYTESFKVVVPAMYFRPYEDGVINMHLTDRDIDLDQHNLMSDGFEPIEDDVPFMDEEPCGDCEAECSEEEIIKASADYERENIKRVTAKTDYGFEVPVGIRGSEEDKCYPPVNKPPVGIPPRWVVDLDRKAQITKAIERYIAAKQPIPVDWIIEYNELVVKCQLGGFIFKKC